MRKKKIIDKKILRITEERQREKEFFVKKLISENNFRSM